ncbi:hypothetical protein AALA61_13275 [Oscillospiraceae bacterium 42-9]
MNYRRPDKEERILRADGPTDPVGEMGGGDFPEKGVHIIAIGDDVDTEKDNWEVQ